MAAQLGRPCGWQTLLTGLKMVGLYSVLELKLLLTGATGEIDVAEAVEQGNTGVQTTLHTKKGCTMGVKRKQYGGVIRDNCWNSTDDNAGCGVRGAVETYGEAFNNNGGGVSVFSYAS